MIRGIKNNTLGSRNMQTPYKEERSVEKMKLIFTYFMPTMYWALN